MEQKNTKLSEYETETLRMAKVLPRLDKQSQVRLRNRIDNLRKSSKRFDEAFGLSLSGLTGEAQPTRKRTSLSKMIDVVTHPLSTVQGIVGTKMLKSRNKAPEILVHPNPLLKKVAEPWDFEKDSKKELLSIVRKMGGALRETTYGDRLGIAATQIGINKRIMVAQGAVCVNPTFRRLQHAREVEYIESCYSVPGKMYTTKRPEYGFCRWFSIEGEQRSFKLKGFDCLVFLHELDHLDGKCCCDIGVEYIKPVVGEGLKV